MKEQIEDLKRRLRGKRVGLLVNPTAVDENYTHLTDLLSQDSDVSVTALFGPEHGVRGCEQAGDHVADAVDPITGIPEFTLYGTRKAPEPEQLDLIDILVFDIQDAGARFYTYIWTMTYAMEACAAAGKPFLVFDRPNPAGARYVAGAPLKFNAGIIGRYWPGTPMSIATAHGLTVGELATLVNEEFLSPKVDLSVVKMPAYRRDMKFEETGYPWVAPSPNMPTTQTARIYFATCIFEGSNISEGRGTTKPFEFTGAPWVKADELARHLNDLNRPGVRFRPVAFTPTFSKFKDERCFGVQVHMTDRETFDGTVIALDLLKAYTDLYPEQVVLRDWCDKLMGIPGLGTRIRTETPQAIIAEYRNDLQLYKKMREKYLIYK